MIKKFAFFLSLCLCMICGVSCSDDGDDNTPSEKQDDGSNYSEKVSFNSENGKVVSCTGTGTSCILGADLDIVSEFCTCENGVLVGCKQCSCTDSGCTE